VKQVDKAIPYGLNLAVDVVFPIVKNSLVYMYIFCN